MKAKYLTIVVAVCASLVMGSAQANEKEREQLALLLEQLNNLEMIAKQSQMVGQDSIQRYRFDYAQLQKDFAAIRKGVEAYLTPRRAQPRAVVDFEGEYTLGDEDGR